MKKQTQLLLGCSEGKYILSKFSFLDDFLLSVCVYDQYASADTDGLMLSVWKAPDVLFNRQFSLSSAAICSS